jgi:hypothetical protein
MMGISWGGFNAIHMAMRKPPALKTIISLMSTDDIYEDDVHFIDGMMHIDAYEIGQDLANAMPGAPDFKIDDSYFKNRFDTKPWLLTYKQQQTDGKFWNRASLNNQYDALTIPSFFIGGLYDGYRDSPPKILQHTRAPVKVLIGPWNHTFPNWADPPPAIEWREEAVRWLDQWLKGIDTGILKEPKFTFYMRDWHAPGSSLEKIPGEWFTMESWPAKEGYTDTLQITANHLLSKSYKPTGIDTLTYLPSAGIEASGSVMWWGDWAPDQQSVDEVNLYYETPELKNEIEILGFPSVTLLVSANQKQAHWIVRLSDVSPSGEVTQITGAGFNGAHRYSSEHPSPIKINEPFLLNIEMHFATWRFQKGHRIRLYVCNAQWPMIWPTPRLMKTFLYTGNNQSNLVLPVISTHQLNKLSFSEPLPDPELPGYGSLSSETNSGFAEVAGVKRDTINSLVQVIATNSGTDQFPWGIIRYDEKIIHQTNDKKPSETSVKSIYRNTVELPERSLVWEGVLDFKSSKKFFFYTYSRNLSINNQFIRKKTWKKKIKRLYQ